MLDTKQGLAAIRLANKCLKATNIPPLHPYRNPGHSWCKLPINSENCADFTRRQCEGCQWLREGGVKYILPTVFAESFKYSPLLLAGQGKG